MSNPSSAVNRMLDAVAWMPQPEPLDNPNMLPFVTHSGVLDLGGIKLKVYQLSNGNRIIDADDLHKLFGII